MKHSFRNLSSDVAAADLYPLGVEPCQVLPGLPNVDWTPEESSHNDVWPLVAVADHLHVCWPVLIVDPLMIFLILNILRLAYSLSLLLASSETELCFIDP